MYLFKVTIGDRDIDNVSELSEEISMKSVDEDQDETSTEDEDELIDASMEEIVVQTNFGSVKNPLTLVSTPTDVSVEKGKTLKMTCVVQGDRPIGTLNKLLTFLFYFFYYRCLLVPREQEAKLL